MARGNRPLEIRLDDQTRARWTAAAQDAGYTLAGYVRDAVEARVEQDAPAPKRRRPPRSPKPTPPGVEEHGVSPLPPRRGRERAVVCEHRVPPTAYCSRGCDD